MVKISRSKLVSVTYSLREFALHGGKAYKNNSSWDIAYCNVRDHSYPYPSTFTP